jgi:type IV secretory pathway TrbF-like protein
MFKKRPPGSAETVETSPHSAIYVAGRREWNEQVGSLVTQRDNWRVTAFGSLAVAFVAVCGIGYVGTRPPAPPFVVKVDKLGSQVVVARADLMAPVDPDVVAGQLGDWIANVRTVFSEVAAQRLLVNRAFAVVASEEPAYQFLRTWYAENEPWARAKTETIGIQVDAVVPLASGPVWQIDWTEHHQSRDGSHQTRENWRATVAVTTSRDKGGVLNRDNPTGLWIGGITWRKLDLPGVRS